MPYLDLSELNVLVTGANHGIGRAIAEHLAQAGARVGVHYDHNAEAAQALADELGHGAIAFKADLFEGMRPSLCPWNSGSHCRCGGANSAPDKEKKVAVIGHVRGGVMAWHVPMHYPERLSKLIMNARHPVPTHDFAPLGTLTAS